MPACMPTSAAYSSSFLVSILPAFGVNVALRLYSVTTQSISKSEKHFPAIEKIYLHCALFRNKLIFYYQIQTLPMPVNTNAVLHLTKSPTKLNLVHISLMLLLFCVSFLYQGQAAAQGVVPMRDCYIECFYNFGFIQNTVKRAGGCGWIFRCGDCVHVAFAAA